MAWDPIRAVFLQGGFPYLGEAAADPQDVSWKGEVTASSSVAVKASSSVALRVSSSVAVAVSSSEASVAVAVSSSAVELSLRFLLHPTVGLDNTQSRSILYYIHIS